jgi:hypothetical protein
LSSAANAYSATWSFGLDSDHDAVDIEVNESGYIREVELDVEGVAVASGVHRHH